MKAIVLHQAGGPEALTLTTIAMPEPSANEVRVRVHALSINPVDWKVRKLPAVLDMFMGTERPVILGWDIAGEVESVGSDVMNFSPGDRVFGMVNFPGHGNAYAEYVVAPADQLAIIPEGISNSEAAAATLAALTAYQSLHGNVNAGDRVLIHAGSGGVGHFAIQMAKELGAHVTATSSAKNRDFVLGLGADAHIDYRTQAFESVVSELDFVLDTLGGEVMERSAQVLKEGGVLVTLPSRDIPAAVKQAEADRGIRLIAHMVHSSGADMEAIGKLLANGKVRAHVSQTFGFDQMADAHAELEKGRAVGKFVVTV